MKLEDLYTDILNMSGEESYSFIASYTSQRSRDLTLPPPAPPKKTKSRTKKSKDDISLTTEQLELLKKLKLV